MTLGNHLCSLTQPAITGQRPLELTGIEYDWTKDEISSTESVEYNTVFGRNVTNIDNI